MQRARKTVIFTKVLPALVLVDVHVDLLDGQQGLSQLGPVGVALRRGPQQLHQQQRVTHHPLHRLDEEGAEVDVISFTPEEKSQRQRIVFENTKTKEYMKNERPSQVYSYT